MNSAFRLLVFCSSVALLSVFALGQDLGSSNKLFGGTKAKTSGRSEKKAAATTKSRPARVRSARKSTRPSSKPTQSSARETPKKGAAGSENSPSQVAKVEITPSKTNNVTVASSAAADELYEKLIEEGNAARDDRNYSAAAAAYQRAVTVKPRDSRASYGLGNIYCDQQHWDEAADAYRKSLDLERGNAIVYIALSYVLSQPIAVSNLSERYQEAEQLARRSIELAPQNALAFDQLGVSLELLGLISAETENAYRTSIRLAPTFAPPYAHLGRLLRRRGLVKESAAAYDTAIQHATDVATMILVAEVMQSEQRFAESEPLLRKAVESDPRNPTGLILLGRALTTLGKFADAEKFLRKSLDVSPNGFMSNSLLGTLFARQGKYELAENALIQALRFVPENEKRRLALQFEAVGDGYLKAGKARNAERAYKQALVLDSEKEDLAGKLEKAHRS